MTIDDYKFIGGEDILKQIEDRLARKNESQAAQPE
jgi:hypothetical protein